MNSKNTSCNIRTNHMYMTAMKACARGQKAGKAMDLLRAAKDLGMELDVYIYTTAREEVDGDGPVAP